jgi:hypothetical protein
MEEVVLTPDVAANHLNPLINENKINKRILFYVTIVIL